MGDADFDGDAGEILDDGEMADPAPIETAGNGCRLRDHCILYQWLISPVAENEEARELARVAEEELLRISDITKQTLSFNRESQRRSKRRSKGSLPKSGKMCSRCTLARCKWASVVMP